VRVKNAIFKVKAEVTANSQRHLPQQYSIVEPIQGRGFTVSKFGSRIPSPNNLECFVDNIVDKVV